MSLSKFGLAAVGLAGLPLITIGLAWQLGSLPGLFEQSSQSGDAPNGESHRVGNTRDATLGTLTRLYIAQDNGVSARVRSGEELAPVDFLNQELERQGEKWRVRDIDGLNANIYDVS